MRIKYTTWKLQEKRGVAGGKRKTVKNKTYFINRSGRRTKKAEVVILEWPEHLFFFLGFQAAKRITNKRSL
jgi:hypothetical protein